MAAGDLILTNTSLTPEDLQKVAAEAEKILAAKSKEPGQFEEVDSLDDVSSLPGIRQQGSAYKLVRVAMSILKGIDGREVELQKTSTYIQWRYAGESSWKNLVALSELKGAKGDKGATGNTGAKGDKGDQIVLRKSSTAIQWKYSSEQDSAYRNLVLLSELKGAKGDTGAKGEKGDTGKTGAQGPKGEKGDTGPQGPAGPKGDTGERGPQGLPGKDGTGAGNVVVKETGLQAGKKYVFTPSQANSANGTFEVLGNAPSATKLASPVTLWGNQFDGSKNVDESIIFSNIGNGKGSVIWNPQETAWKNGWVRGLYAIKDDLNYYVCGIYGKNGDLIRYFYGGTNESNSAIYVIPNKNVGIGTTSPAEKLEVNGNVKARGNVITSNINGFKVISNSSDIDVNILQWNNTGYETPYFFRIVGTNDKTLYFQFSPDYPDGRVENGNIKITGMNVSPLESFYVLASSSKFSGKVYANGGKEVLTEAPKDDKTYGRKNGAWVVSAGTISYEEYKG